MFFSALQAPIDAPSPFPPPPPGDLFIPEWSSPPPPPRPPPGPPNDFGYYFYFVVHIIIDVLTVILNFSAILIMHRSKSSCFKTTFYLLLSVFMQIMLVVALVSIISTIYYFSCGKHTPLLDFLVTAIDLYTSYLSVALLFLLSFNRMAIFVLPNLNTVLFTRTKMWLILLAIVLGILGATIWLYQLMGISVNSNNAGGPPQVYASNLKLLHVVNIVSYCIPLSSVLFYLPLYLHLRRQRRAAVSDLSQNTFSKAETSTALQGIVILFVYLSAMILHVAMLFLPNHGIIKLFMNGLRDLVESAPQLAIPITSITCSKEMKKAIKIVFCCRNGDEPKTNAVSSKSRQLQTK